MTGAFAVVGSGPLGREQLAMMGPEPLDVVIATAQLVGGSMLALVLVPRMLLAVLFAISHRQSQAR